MAATINIGLQFPWNLSNKANKENVVTTGNFLRLSFHSSTNTNKLNIKRRFSLVTASSHSNHWKVDTINGTKVNGVHVVEAPRPVRKLSNESTAEEALVTCFNGRFVENRFVYRQIFVIRSYEIGPDKTATLETILNFLQVINCLHNSCIIKHMKILKCL